MIFEGKKNKYKYPYNIHGGSVVLHNSLGDKDRRDSATCLDIWFLIEFLKTLPGESPVRCGPTTKSKIEAKTQLQIMNYTKHTCSSNQTMSVNSVATLSHSSLSNSVDDTNWPKV